MIAKRRGRKRQRRTSRSERYAQQRSAPRRNESTPKHESASLAHQQRQKNRAATRQANPQEGRDARGVGVKASRDRATSSRLHEQQYRVDASCLNQPMHPSQGQSTYKEKRRGTVGQGVARAHQTCKRNLSANLEVLQEVEVGGLEVEVGTVLSLVHRDIIQASTTRETTKQATRRQFCEYHATATSMDQHVLAQWSDRFDGCAGWAAKLAL